MRGMWQFCNTAGTDLVSFCFRRRLPRLSAWRASESAANAEASLALECSGHPSCFSSKMPAFAAVKQLQLLFHSSLSWSGQGCRPLVWSRTATYNESSRLWESLRYVSHFKPFPSTALTFENAQTAAFTWDSAAVCSRYFAANALHWLLNLSFDWGVRPLRRAGWHFWILLLRCHVDK